VRLVLDSNTVVSALLWHGPPYQLFTRSRAFSLAFFSTPTLLTEFEEVLAYPKLAKAVATYGLTPAQLLQRYLRLAVVQPGPITPTVLADSDDDHVLACAFAAKAELMVSRDRHPLGLHEYQGIPILNTSDALQRLEAKSTG